MKDQIILINGCWYAVVNDRQFGPWVCREYAMAGLQVEQKREARKFIRNVPWQPKSEQENSRP